MIGTGINYPMTERNLKEKILRYLVIVTGLAPLPDALDGGRVTWRILLEEVIISVCSGHRRMY
jgi:hypothetical protein